MKQTIILTVSVLLLMALVGCAPDQNQLVNTPDTKGKVAGFWSGLWHGFIAPVTFIISLFSKKVHIYEVHNNGGWYNFGFLLGMMIIFGGGGGGACRSKRCRD